MIRFFFLIVFTCFTAYGETQFAKPIPSIDNPRQIIFSISAGDDESINHVLSTANNVLKFYGPENVEMEIVAYYHGIRALLKSEKEISVRVRALMQYDVKFVACGNTMETKKIRPDELIEGSEIVTAGIVEVIEQIRSGATYIRL
ncbi:MAG: DsrE family protein [Sulfuricurvum sp.]|nr:DsrE family protein [Sulfuricurvum sp.]MDP3022166.1 DsrE family protein [Sulfuricurvum sp.]